MDFTDPQTTIPERLCNRLQFFTAMTGTFHVEMIWQFLRDNPDKRKLVPVPVKDWFPSIVTPDQRKAGRLDGFDADPEHAKNADLSIPLLQVEWVDMHGSMGRLVVDGYHRLYKAGIESIEFLPGYLISFKDARDNGLALFPHEVDVQKDARRVMEHVVRCRDSRPMTRRECESMGIDFDKLFRLYRLEVKKGQCMRDQIIELVETPQMVEVCLQDLKRGLFA